MQALFEPLKELKEFEELEKRVKHNRGILQISGCIDSQKLHILSGLGKQTACRVILTYSETKAREIYEEYSMFPGKVLFYPAKDLLFHHADIRGNQLGNQRMQIWKQILEGEELTIVTTIDGCMDCLLPKQVLKDQVLVIDLEEQYDIGDVRKALIAMGYERNDLVEMPGQFGTRGGIVDIFPYTEELPIRIEFFGDEINSIRSFDPESQRSIEELDGIQIFPGETPKESAELPGKEDMVSFLSYFDEDAIFFLDEPNRLGERARFVEMEFRESMTHRLEKEQIEPKEAELLYTYREVVGILNRKNCVAVSALEPKPEDWEIQDKFSLNVKSVSPYNNSMELLKKDLSQWKKIGYRVLLLSASRTRAKRLAVDLQELGFNSYYNENMDHKIEPGEIMTSYGKLHKGYEYPLIKFVVISESDIFGIEKKKRKKKKVYDGQKISGLKDLKVGDYVVHESHGMGIYRGIEKIEVEKIEKDYIKIEYSGGGNLYILATQLDAIQKYSDGEGRKPKLNKLGSQEWVKTKTRVQKAVTQIAEDLVELYAKRQARAGFVYQQDTVWQREFEELFPFEETEDQLLAIEAVKRDMESSKIMDRLICGDVGYGKTEIAIRAAFKAVQDGKQVVYLVPTTILAGQHYNTFAQRMKDFPINVDLLCRFRTGAEQKKTIEKLRKGQVDIVIGTHRVLSDDVVFKDLGLLIIDEEQRFGVGHKEKIKKMKENVDVLTMTATPIPRTLHMSLIGIRDMSVLEEPPMDRLPIQTYVLEYDSEMIREAINRELARGGQVYYVHNKVQNIDEVALRIAQLVPDGRVEFAHGQMKEQELERKMFEFINGEIDVLVSTTIIETGLDISNVNTIIIDDADNFGLSQLYQLRGRVGRSNRTAYAFLLYRRNKMLKEVAEKRLRAIREYTELGSGIKIAMKDLEIRGAGTLLGELQHGQMEAVGYDLYCKMLNEAVKQLKGVPVSEKYETSIDVELDAYIPATYIKNEFQKLDIYKRIAGIESKEEQEDMVEELIDRFGDLPRQVENLLHIADLKNQAHQVYGTNVVAKGDEIKIPIFEKAKINPAKIPQLLQKYNHTLHFQLDPPMFVYQRRRNDKESLISKLEMLLADMKEFLVDPMEETEKRE